MLSLDVVSPCIQICLCNVNSWISTGFSGAVPFLANKSAGDGFAFKMLIHSIFKADECQCWAFVFWLVWVFYLREGVNMVTKLVSFLICKTHKYHTTWVYIIAYTHALLAHGSCYLEGRLFFYILVGFALEVREAQLGAPALFKRIPQGCFSVKVKTDDTMWKGLLTCQNLYNFKIHLCIFSY